MSILLRRVLSYIVDLFLIVLVMVFLSVLLGDKQPDGSYNVKFPWALIPMSFYIVYFVIQEHFFRKTLGKRIFKLEIIPENNKPLSFTRSFVRHLFDFVDIFCLVGVLMIFLSKNNRRIGDRLSKCDIIYINN